MMMMMMMIIIVIKSQQNHDIKLHQLMLLNLINIVRLNVLPNSINAL
jgi:hypothetical protein